MDVAELVPGDAERGGLRVGALEELASGSASSMSRWEDSGSCQPVMSPLTARRPRSGVITTSVQPAPAWTVPSSVAAVSSARTTVPSATTRPPQA